MEDLRGKCLSTYLIVVLEGVQDDRDCAGQMRENFAGGSWLKIAEDEELWAAAEGFFTLA